MIHHRKCEAKRAYVEVCPYEVLGVQRISRADWEDIGTIGRIRSRVHGRRTAYAVTPDARRGCGLCVVVCPEDAITQRAFLSTA